MNDVKDLVARFDASLRKDDFARIPDRLSAEDVRRRGHGVIAALLDAGIAITEIKRDHIGRTAIELEHGAIINDDLQRNLVLRIGAQGDRSGSLMAESDDPATVVDQYVEQVVPRDMDIRQGRDAARRAREAARAAKLAEENAVIKAYEALPEEMRHGFRTIMDYLSLHEQRTRSPGCIGSGGQIASGLQRRLRQLESDGMPGPRTFKKS